MRTHTEQLTLITMILFILSGCGIPDYPYLYPPERLDVESQIGFEHDSDNDPGVFEGYEIYYRIYQQPDDGTDIDTTILNDMNGYFNSTTNFINISNEDYPSNVWYRRVMITTDTDDNVLDSIPHIDVSAADCEKKFSVALFDTDGYMYFQFSLDYSGDDLRGYSDIIGDPGELLTFTREDFLLSRNTEDPVVGNDIDLTGPLDIAFFAVPYGSDDVNPAPIYANGTSSDMLYIGKLSLD